MPERASLSKHQPLSTEDRKNFNPISESAFEQSLKMSSKRRGKENFVGDGLSKNLHVSMDSDNAQKFGHSNKRLPFGQLEPTKNRNYAGSPPPILGQNINTIHYRNGDPFGAATHSLPVEHFSSSPTHYLHDQMDQMDQMGHMDRMDRMMRMSNHFAQKKVTLPGLR